jgi:hypothetical protein
LRFLRNFETKLRRCNMTEEQRKKYLDLHGVQCPCCKSSNITSLESPEADFGGAYQECECRDCGAQWQDIYDLIDVHVTKEGDKI